MKQILYDMGPLTRHGNNSSPTGNLEYRGNSYCKVRDTVFVLDYNIIVKELQGKASHKWRCCSQFQLLVRLDIIAWPGGLSILAKVCCKGCS